MRADVSHLHHAFDFCDVRSEQCEVMTLVHSQTMKFGKHRTNCVYLFYYRKAIPLCKNEGVYVRDVQTGKVRAVMGPQSYLLTENEELWEKDLSNEVDFLLQYVKVFINTL